MPVEADGVLLLLRLLYQDTAEIWLKDVVHGSK